MRLRNLNFHPVASGSCCWPEDWELRASGPKRTGHANCDPRVLPAASLDTSTKRRVKSWKPKLKSGLAPAPKLLLPENAAFCLATDRNLVMAEPGQLQVGRRVVMPTEKPSMGALPPERA